MRPPCNSNSTLPTFATFADAYQARWTVVRMAAEGWNKKSIADCLKLSRSHVYTILEAFERDGFAGLEDQRTRPPQHPENQLSLPFFKEVLDLQQAYPRAGRFRIHGLLGQQREEPPPSERTVGRAMAINRQFHGAPGPWQSARDAQTDELSLKPLPYRPGVPPSSVVHGYSLPASNLRAAGSIASVLSKAIRGRLWPGWLPHQDLTAVLQILYAALAAYGCPQAMVSDNGSVFTAEGLPGDLCGLGH